MEMESRNLEIDSRYMEMYILARVHINFQVATG